MCRCPHARRAPAVKRALQHNLITHCHEEKRLLHAGHGAVLVGSDTCDILCRRERDDDLIDGRLEVLLDILIVLEACLLEQTSQL